MCLALVALEKLHPSAAGWCGTEYSPCPYGWFACFCALLKAIWLYHGQRPLLSKLKWDLVYFVPHVGPDQRNWAEKDPVVKGV